MATTTYNVIAIDSNDNETLVITKSKKSVAVDAGLAHRNATGAHVVVRTGAGTVVAEFKAPKKIKMSAPYTRVVAVPADVEINGKRVAYKRTRVGYALLDAGKGDYTIFDLEKNVEVGEVDVATTREAGRWFADVAPALRAATV